MHNPFLHIRENIVSKQARVKQIIFNCPWTPPKHEFVKHISNLLVLGLARGRLAQSLLAIVFWQKPSTISGKTGKDRLGETRRFLGLMIYSLTLGNITTQGHPLEHGRFHAEQAPLLNEVGSDRATLLLWRNRSVTQTSIDSCWLLRRMRVSPCWALKCCRQCKIPEKV